MSEPWQSRHPQRRSPETVNPTEIPQRHTPLPVERSIPHSAASNDMVISEEDSLK